MKNEVEIYDAGNGITAVTLNGDCIAIVTKSTKYLCRYALFLIAEKDFIYGDDLTLMLSTYFAIKETGI